MRPSSSRSDRRARAGTICAYTLPGRTQRRRNGTARVLRRRMSCSTLVRTRQSLLPLYLRPSDGWLPVRRMCIWTSQTIQNVRALCRRSPCSRCVLRSFSLMREGELTVGQYLSPSGGMSRAEYDILLESLSSSKRKALAPEVGRLRAIKSKYEQEVMRQAADVSARAHNKIMRFTEPGMSEHVVAAHFEYLCAREGSQRPAYVPVVASG